MKLIVSIGQEIWSLFVSEGWLTGAVLAWCALCGLALARLVSPGAGAVIWFAGCAGLLVVDVVLASRRP
jgi:hypothetical protein